MIMRNPCLVALLLSAPTMAFQGAAVPNSAARPVSSTITATQQQQVSSSRSRLNLSPQDDHDNSLAQSTPTLMKTLQQWTTLTALCAALTLTPPTTAHAVSNYDATTGTVKTTIAQLQNARGDPALTLAAYEKLADIITEGTGVGGAINYKGVQLERGYVADEDTTIYNPGLTLLTETEKEKLTDAVIQARKSGVSANQWSDDLEFGYDYLKTRLDPLHMVELRGYLSILPFYGAAVYLVVLAIQQLVRDLFPPAYLIGVVAVFGPVGVLIAAGPQ